jgi:hypothetical protein
VTREEGGLLFEAESFAVQIGRGGTTAQAPQTSFSATPVLDYDVIIGAGMSGMYQLLRLHQLDMRVRVFEASTDASALKVCGESGRLGEFPK